MPYKLQPRTIQQKWQDYCKKCDQHTVSVRYRDELIEVPKPKIYCFERFCCSIGIGEDELKEYEDNKNYKATFKDIRFAVLARKLEALVNGEGSTSGLIFDLKANYGIFPQKLKKEENGVMEVTLNLGPGCGDALTGEGAPLHETDINSGGATAETGAAGQNSDNGTGDAVVANNEQAAQPPPEPLRPGIDYPVILNKQPAPPTQPIEPETGYKGYKNYASYWARHYIY